MKKHRFKAILFLFSFVLLSSDFSFAQTVAGKIYSREDADKLFGPVLEKVSLDSDQFQKLVNNSGAVIMFKFESSGLYIFNDKRNVIYSTGQNKTFLASDILKFYSLSVVNDLLNKGQASTVTIEKRQNVISITDGSYTMEDAIACPPICP
ncbi:MAG: hypothetical protein ACM3Q2_14155 [Syntrophothermus sp.]